MQLDLFEPDQTDFLIDRKLMRMENWKTKIDRQARELAYQISLFEQECLLLKILIGSRKPPSDEDRIPKLKDRSKLAAHLGTFCG